MLFGRRGPRWLSGYNFTERVRNVLALAREEAVRLRHGYVGTEHMLLAIVDEGSSSSRAAAVLRARGVDLSAMRRRLGKTVKPGRSTIPSGSELPYTSRAKKVLELATTEARELGHDGLGTEHLLLGLIREERGIAAQLLAQAGVTLDGARGEVLRMVATELGESSMASGPDAGILEPGDFPVRIDDASSLSIYEQIVAQVREAVATGRLAPGDRLPTVRQLADELDIAPGTVARAYTELERLGVVVTEGARGTRVGPRKTPGISADDRPATLVGLLRPVAVAAFHLGATADELRAALEKAMTDIFGPGERDAA
jgi:DNA-binding transcriptional regulator YhcF (GntR family)